MLIDIAIHIYIYIYIYLQVSQAGTVPCAPGDEGAWHSKRRRVRAKMAPLSQTLLYAAICPYANCPLMNCTTVRDGVQRSDGLPGLAKPYGTFSHDISCLIIYARVKNLFLKMRIEKFRLWIKLYFLDQYQILCISPR